MREIFDRFRDLTVAVVGDYCLDEYFWIDAALNEPSLETGLVAYQCVKTETFPGAAGTVAKNLAILGVGAVYAIGYIGDDGRGAEMKKGLDRQGINRECLITADSRITPAYVKPWIIEGSQTREMNRIDIKNRTPSPAGLTDAVMAKLEERIGRIDAILIMDQMTEDNCGLITDDVRARLAGIARDNPGLIVYADSRSRTGMFRDMIVKGNEFEILRAAYGEDGATGGKNAGYIEKIRQACKIVQGRTGKPVIVTLGAQGARIFDNDREIRIPGIQLTGQLDVTGAGDTFSAAFVSALAAGADMETAGIIGNTAAAVCVTQIGTSGRVTAEEIIYRNRA